MSAYGYFKHNEMSGYAISHHGIKGQKWGIRRFQNPDGSLTAEGMRRYGVYSQHKQIANKFDSMTSKMSKNKALLKDKAFMDEYKKAGADWENELKKYKDKDYRKSIKTGKKLEKSLSNSITDKVLKGEKVSWNEPTKFYNGNKIDAKKTVSENIEAFYKNGRKEKLAQEVLSKIKKDPNYGVSVHDIWDNTEAAVSKGLSEYLGLKSDNDKREIRFELVGDYDTYMDDITNLITKKIKDKGIDVY